MTNSTDVGVYRGAARVGRGVLSFPDVVFIHTEERHESRLDRTSVAVVIRVGSTTVRGAGSIVMPDPGWDYPIAAVLLDRGYDLSTDRPRDPSLPPPTDPGSRAAVEKFVHGYLMTMRTGVNPSQGTPSLGEDPGEDPGEPLEPSRWPHWMCALSNRFCGRDVDDHREPRP